MPARNRMSPQDPNLIDHERRLARLEAARHEMEETLIVIGEIERRQSALHKEHAERIVEHERWYVRMKEIIGDIDKRLADVSERLAGTGQKLDGLIGWAEGTILGNKPPKGPKQ